MGAFTNKYYLREVLIGKRVLNRIITVHRCRPLQLITLVQRGINLNCFLEEYASNDSPSLCSS